MHFILKDKLIIVKPSIGPYIPLNYNRTFLTILFSLTQSIISTTSCSLLGLSRRVGQRTSMNIFYFDSRDTHYHQHQPEYYLRPVWSLSSSTVGNVERCSNLVVTVGLL